MNYNMGVGNIGSNLYMCVVMECESRMIVGFGFSSKDTEKFRMGVCKEAGLDSMPPTSRLISAFFASLKAEKMNLYKYVSNTERKESASNYIQFYNEVRPHASLDYKTPREVYVANMKKTMS